MKLLSSALCALALFAGGSFLASPALAQPARIIVRGATPILPPPAFVYDNNGGYYANPDRVFGEDPNSPFYDHAGKYPDYRYYGPPAVDLVLARTLDRNDESMLTHMMRCQAAFGSFNPATNAYTGRNGIPQVCYR